MQNMKTLTIQIIISSVDMDHLLSVFSCSQLIKTLASVILHYSFIFTFDTCIKSLVHVSIKSVMYTSTSIDLWQHGQLKKCSSDLHARIISSQKVKYFFQTVKLYSKIMSMIN